MQYTRKTPGVYVTELSAFPPSIVGVQTAVPAFIGYTEKAEISGKPAYLKPIKIGSLADYEAVFGGRYKPIYKIDPVTSPTLINQNKYDFKVFDPTSTPHSPPASPLASPPASPPDTPPIMKYYNLTQVADSHFNLYNSMRLFYANGGGNCYVVSVQNYEQVTTVQLSDLVAGLNVIREQVGPTMLVIPDAVLLPPSTPPTGTKPPYSADFMTLIQLMLAQCQDLQDRVAILDLYGTQYINRIVPATGTTSAYTATLDDVVGNFRTEVGEKSLNYGMAYFPFLNTTVVPVSDFDYTNFNDSADAQNLTLLKTILTWQNQNLYYKDGVATPRSKAVQADIDKIPTTLTGTDVTKLNQNINASIPLLGDMLNIIVAKNDVLPPSGAMAGVYTWVDTTRGVWNAPANITLSAVEETTYKLNDTQQGDLNVPVNGKAVNAIREFVGRGQVVWGARTLDGNSNDYRYIQVRRTLIYIEQSVKTALNPFVFAPNDGNTWVTVTSMVSNFLQGLWSAGGLMGATAADAFTVQCGLGSTMTGLDILNGYMIVQVTLQMIRPAEFIELTFKQKMEGVS
ncbi:MAG: phage tail sheath C-terminal domain-containing protein [Pyrinomonadaceae bacterium]